MPLPFHLSWTERLILTCLPCMLAACAGPGRGGASMDAHAVLLPGAADAPSQLTPTEALGIAQSYARHSWRPFARNILHGADPHGIKVNTPDRGFCDERGRSGWWLPGEVNEGVPYKWGGFDDLASFDQGMAAGHAAGDVSSPAKRAADNAGVSALASGVDCSGLISRCLKLPRVYDTTQLPELCEPVPPASLRPGDLLNIPKGHVVLCAGWVDTDKTWIYYYETGGPPDYWRPGLKQAPLKEMIELGYQPLRYRGMAREAALSGKEVLTRSTRSAAAVVPVPVVGEP